MVALAGILGAGLVGLAGPLLATRLQASSSLAQRMSTRRLDAYAVFAAHVESMQLQLDRATASGTEIDDTVMADLAAKLETSRAHIDFIGSTLIRVWAYRCSLAIERAVAESSSGESESGARARAKLHDARSQFVQNARRESATSQRHLRRAGHAEDNAFAHRAWLEGPPTSDAADAVALSIQVIERIARSESPRPRTASRHAEVQGMDSR